MVSKVGLLGGDVFFSKPGSMSRNCSRSRKQKENKGINTQNEHWILWTNPILQIIVIRTSTRRKCKRKSG